MENGFIPIMHRHKPINIKKPKQKQKKHKLNFEKVEAMHKFNSALLIYVSVCLFRMLFNF